MGGGWGADAIGALERNGIAATSFKGQLPSAATTRQGGLKLYIKRAEAPTLVLQSKNKQHCRLALILEFRCVDESRSAGARRS